MRTSTARSPTPSGRTPATCSADALGRRAPRQKTREQIVADIDAGIDAGKKADTAYALASLGAATCCGRTTTIIPPTAARPATTTSTRPPPASNRRPTRASPGPDASISIISPPRGPTRTWRGSTKSPRGQHQSGRRGIRRKRPRPTRNLRGRPAASAAVGITGAGRTFTSRRAS